MKRPYALALSLFITGISFSQNLQRMPYRNPEGTSFLGVGLWAWPMAIDYDGDGDLDLVISCPDKPSNGTYFFENPTPKGQKCAMPVFKPAKLIDEGRGNICAQSVRGKTIVTTPGAMALDFVKDGFSKLLPIKGLKGNIHSNGVRGNVWRLADYDGDGREDLLVGVGDWKKYGWANAYDENGKWKNEPIHGYVYWIRNLDGSGPDARYGKPEKIRLTDGTLLDVYGNPMPMLEDWDGDGDLDIICGEFIDGFTFFENVGTRSAPRYAPGQKVLTEAGERLHMDLEMITPSAVDWDGDGDLDIICGDEDGRVAFLENTGKKKGKMPLFKAPDYFRQKMDNVFFGALSTPCACDWDGDGDEDLIVGNSAGYIAFIENLSGKGVATPKWAEPVCLQADGKTIRIQAGENGSIQGPCESKWGYTTVSVADWDGDGKMDIMANSIFGDIIWYRNIGTRTAPRLAAAQPVEVEWEGEQPTLKWGWRKPKGKALLTQWRTTPVMNDWNHDGLMDLVMLDQEGYLSLFTRARKNGALVLLHPKRVFCNEKGLPLQMCKGAAGGSGRRKICLTDWNGDGKTDLIFNSVNAEVWLQTTATNGTWCFINTGNVDAQRLAGHTTSPTAVDFDANGIPDLLIGAEDGFFYTLENPRFTEMHLPKEYSLSGLPILFTGNDRVWLAGTERMIPNCADFSLFLEVKCNTGKSKEQQHLVSNNAGQPGRAELGISYHSSSTGKLFWWLNNNITLISRTVIADGIWHKVGLIKENGKYRLFVDGRCEAEGTCTSPIVTVSPWALGASSARTISFPFRGQIKNFRFFRYVLKDQL